MAITAQKVNELRQITGAGMMDCKKALVESEGDIEKAIEFLRKQGQKVAAKRADRETNEGVVYAHVFEGGKSGLAFAFTCETEPVSRTEEFLKLSQLALEQAIAHKPASAEALLAVQVDGKALSEHITELTGRIGEKIEVSSYAMLEADQVVPYLHGSKIAVLVGLQSTGGADRTEAGKDVAMQIAAMKPLAVDANGVDADTIAKEKEIAVERARNEGKPENVLERIADGYVKKYLEENTLLGQAFVKDAKQTVKQYLDSVSKGMTVSGFVRVGIGR